jgi:hypothetical protein
VSVQAPEDFDWRAAEEALENPNERPETRIRRLTPRAIGFIAGAIAALVLVSILTGPVRRLVGAAAAGANPPAPTTLAWAIQTSSGSLIAVVSLPGANRPASLVVIPGDTIVDLPGGGAGTIGAAATTPGMTVAAAQATLNVRVPHYLLINEADLEALVDRLGGISVDAEDAFVSRGQPLGPGPVHLLGADVASYLAAYNQQPGDLTSRWEDVLTGVFNGSTDPRLWTFPLGQSDDVSLAGRILAAAHGTPLFELPTVASDGVVEPDTKAIAALTSKTFAPTLPLIRVVVLSENGRPDMGAAISTILAPHGYRVVAAQDDAYHDEPLTQVVASNESFLPQAQQVMALLKAGNVYVGAQPTGIADITIVVGKDFKGI